MKYLLLLLSISILISCTNKENLKTELIEKTKIDSLISEKDVNDFIIKLDSNYKDFKVLKSNDFKNKFIEKDDSKKIADSLGIKSSFFKEDFDNNGFTDILVTGVYYDFSMLVILSQGRNKFKIKPLVNDMNSQFAKISYIDELPLINLFKRKKTFEVKNNKSLNKKTLTYKFDDFIEFNKNPKKNEISKIEFSTSGCFGTCPVYELILNKDSTSIFHARYFNFNKNKEVVYGKEEGTFKTEINPKDFNKIVQILNYSNFENLQNPYSVGWTDDQTGNLKITYNNGKVKQIEDYGMCGTYGLHLVYSEMSKLRFNQKWKK